MPFPGRGETVGGRAPSRVGPSWARPRWSVSIGNVSKARRESRPRGARAGRWPGDGRGLLLASRLLCKACGGRHGNRMKLDPQGTSPPGKPVPQAPGAPAAALGAEGGVPSPRRSAPYGSGQVGAAGPYVKARLEVARAVAVCPRPQLHFYRHLAFASTHRDKRPLSFQPQPREDPSLVSRTPILRSQRDVVSWIFCCFGDHQPQCHELFGSEAGGPPAPQHMPGPSPRPRGPPRLWWARVQTGPAASRGQALGPPSVSEMIPLL